MNTNETKFLTPAEIIKTVLFAVILGVVLNTYIIANAVVPTGSMSDTIEVNSKFILDKISYAVIDPRRGDIITFYAPDDENTLYLKRIIALPGETIEGKDGEVYIDGEVLTEDYVKDKIQDNFGPYEVPEDCYFVMGDNRLNSWDSRFWDKKYVAKDKILGKALFEYSPTLKWFSKEKYK